MSNKVSATLVRFITAVLAAVMIFAAVFTVPAWADEDIPDRYQTDEENGDDTEKPQDSMRLMDTYTYDAAFENQISVFPDSYKDALRRIHSMYPNFTFVADNINMKLSDAVLTQIENGYKTYRGAYTDDYDTIFKFMDPLTYLYPEYDGRYDVYSSSFNPSWHVDADFFMFADHAYSSNQYGAALYNLIEGCDFLENENMNDIIAASALHQMNPYVMASTVILEKGWHALANGNGDVTGRIVDKGRVSSADVYSEAGGSYKLGTLSNTDVYIVRAGTTTTPDGKTWYKIVYDHDGNLFDTAVHGVPGFVETSKVTGVQYFNTYYNLFSINQTDNNPVVGGIAYAMSRGWTSIADSFEGGAKFCKNAYYDNDQPTYYYMHYNVLNSPSNWWHEYSTGVSAGLKCARILRYGYDYDHNQTLVMRIPVYQPETPHWLKLDDKWYYILSSGRKATGWVKVGGVWYYMNSQGVMQTGWQKVDGIWYYMDASGAMQTGWKQINGRWYYLNSRGEMLTGFRTIGGITYYLAPSGAMQTGWQKVDGTWYYMDQSGEVQTGWLNINDKLYYLDQSGAMYKSWHMIDGVQYYFGTSGAMCTGWQKIDGIWYLFDDEGEMQTGWKMVNGYWYYLDPEGEMLTGWNVINGKYYYLKPSGRMAEREWVQGYWWLSAGGAWKYTYRGYWVQDDRGWRFEDESGWYAKSTSTIINNVEYTFDDEGYLLE